MNELKSYNLYSNFSSDYSIENKIGVGAYAEVFKVKNVKTDIFYATKVIDMKNLSLKDK